MMTSKIWTTWTLDELKMLMTAQADVNPTLTPFYSEVQGYLTSRKFWIVFYSDQPLLPFFEATTLAIEMKIPLSTLPRTSSRHFCWPKALEGLVTSFEVSRSHRWWHSAMACTRCSRSHITRKGDFRNFFAQVERSTTLSQN